MISKLTPLSTNHALAATVSPAPALLASADSTPPQASAPTDFSTSLLAGYSVKTLKEESSTQAQPSEDLRQAFDDFVGQTLFGSMLAEMRKSLQGAAYFGGGRAEAVFQGQLDQHLVERISRASANSITDPMFDLFMVSR